MKRQQTNIIYNKVIQSLINKQTSILRFYIEEKNCNERYNGTSNKISDVASPSCQLMWLWKVRNKPHGCLIELAPIKDTIEQR